MSTLGIPAKRGELGRNTDRNLYDSTIDPENEIAGRG